MSESLEELKAIRDGAPKGATLYDGEYFKFDGDEYHRWALISDIQDWYFDLEPSCDVRSLSDINRIIDLTEALLLISDLSLVTGDEGIQKRLDSLLTERNT